MSKHELQGLIARLTKSGGPEAVDRMFEQMMGIPAK
jgi:hypothetical protein